MEVNVQKASCVANMYLHEKDQMSSKVNSETNKIPLKSAQRKKCGDIKKLLFIT
jgi:hypothetical protein